MQVPDETAEVERRARVYGLVPIREIQKRGWIKSNLTVDELEEELKRFLSVPSLDQPPPFVGATRRIGRGSLSPAQLAWCARARQMAAALQVNRRFNPAKAQETEQALRELAAYPKEARHLPKVLAIHGIRFVVVEPLPGAKIDGAAFWLDEHSPVIAVSVRYDRVDTFWFTVMHEFRHIAHGDGLSVDTDLMDPMKPPAAANEIEERANREAATSLVPARALESFIRRVGPLYSRQRVIQFAHTVRVHPGIIVGQLQHRGEIGYSALRDLLSKVRDVVTDTALTDGWGKSITQGLL